MSARHVGIATSLLAIALLGYLGPIQSVLWNAGEAPRWLTALPLVDASITGAPAVAPSVAPYDLFGRLVSAVYLALLIALISRHSSNQRRLVRVTASATIVALTLAFAADVAAYWIAGLADSSLREAVFWRVELPMLGVVVVGLAGIGWASRVDWTGRILLLTPVFAIVATASLHYMPHGPLFGIALAIGTSALRRPRVT